LNKVLEVALFDS